VVAGEAVEGVAAAVVAAGGAGVGVAGGILHVALLLDDEIDRRQSKMLVQRLHRARFEEVKTPEEFDFRFNPQIPAEPGRTDQRAPEPRRSRALAAGGLRVPARATRRRSPTPRRTSGQPRGARR
jgi:hypothetical protein